MTATQANVGKETERMVAGWLRLNGWPGAERTVRTGYRVKTRESADQGDIDGCPGLCWQIKSLRPHTRAELAVPAWLAETEAQRVASGSAYGFLVVRRWGGTDVGRWWAFQRMGHLQDILLGHDSHEPGRGHIGRLVPVRMDMAALAGVLTEAGWAGVEAVA